MASQLKNKRGDKNYSVCTIIEYNYWEHIKTLKELSLILAPDNPRIISINKSANELLEKINFLKNNSETIK